MTKSFTIPRESEFFAGMRFDLLEMDYLVKELMEFKDGFAMIVTPNVDHIVRANKKTELIELYNSADISVNDSRVLKLTTRLINKDLGEVIPGSDLTKHLIEEISEQAFPITIIGASTDTVESIKKKYNLKKVFHYNPPMGFINDESEVEKCVKFILEHKSKFIFLAVGSPRQEIVAQKAKNAGASGIALCIGASLLFLSGEEKRAPKIFQKLSLEWLFRMIQSPERLAKRYFHDALGIVPLLIKEGKRK